MNGSIEDIVALMKKYLSGDADYTDDKDIIKFGREFGRRSGNMLQKPLENLRKKK